MDYMNLISNIEQALQTWNKFLLVMVHNYFYTLLDLICWSFAEDFCIRVYERYWYVVFL